MSVLGRNTLTATHRLGRLERSRLVAAALAGAWRPSPPPLALSCSQLAEVTPSLLKAGVGALGWWRVRSSALRTCPAAEELHQAYRLHTLLTALKEEQVKQAIKLLHAAGVEPLLAKGWAAGRLYPEPGLRPYGDIDLYVRPEHHQAAWAALTEPGVTTPPVDLHRGCPDLEDRSLDVLYHRSQLVSLGDVAVRILGPEDHLRLLCLHFLRHGACRALSLCDIGVVLESLPADFDWDYFLEGDRRRSEWAVCNLGLAHHLLGARLEASPVAGRAKHLPRWLVPTVLRHWTSGWSTPRPVVVHLRRPAGVLGEVGEALRQRWPNPIFATLRWHGPFGPLSWLPRLPVQISEVLVRRNWAHLGQSVGRLFSLDDPLRNAERT